MPPVGPQGSRGGLIAAVVVFTILFVTATIFAIYSFVALDKEQELNKHLASVSKAIYQDTSSPRFDYLNKTERLHVRDHTVLTAAIEDSRQLAELIAGSTASTTQPTLAVQDAHQVVNSVNSRFSGLSIPPDSSLLDVINRLAAYTAYLQSSDTDLRKGATEASADAVRQINLAEHMTQTAQADLAAANALKQQYLDQVQQTQASYQQKLKSNALVMDQERADVNAQLKKLQALGDAKDRTIDTQNKQIVGLNAKLALKRVGVTDPILRQADGQIVSVASEDIVYINLGMGDHIVPGMTFEVYDLRQGIPKQEDLMSPDNLPVGKASIEVERVDSNSSQCRVIKTEVGQHISEGDLIANLVYDRNTKYKFVVYGDFNLDQSDVPRTGDNKKIEALIVNWGGEIQKEITPDTDFVVMGMEPTVPVFTADELEDPLNADKQAKAKAALDAYEAVLNHAVELTIPIMNQNRFLYFCGYYENAQR